MDDLTTSGDAERNGDGSPSALVLLAEGSEEIETLAPADVLVRAGVRVTLGGVNGLMPSGSRSLPLRADRLIGALRGTLYDAIVIPGGAGGAESIARSESARLLIKHHWESGRIVAAICAAPAVVLLPMGLLAGRRVTGYPGTRARLAEAASYLDDDVVEDGTLITSRGPGTAIVFGLAIAARLTDDDTAAKVAEAMLV